MRTIFKIETDRVSLTWSLRRAEPVFPSYSTFSPPPGRLRIIAKRSNAIFSPTNWRAEVPDSIAADWLQTAGPRLFEETDYLFYLHAKQGHEIGFTNRDPSFVQAVSHEGSDSIHGMINFGSQVGLTLFSVTLNGVPEFDFEVEVFPSKIDYSTDYEELTAEIQDVCTGLALEYLRSTFKFGAGSQGQRSSLLEWAILLKNGFEDLEKAVLYISQHPHWNIEREAEDVRADRLKRIDSSVRRAVARGAGSGRFVRGRVTFPFRERISERTPHSTLDTPEHRWLAHQLRAIRRRLSQLSLEEPAGRGRAQWRSRQTERQSTIRGQIVELEQRITRLLNTDPLSSAGPIPPANFASTKLLGTPGYREAYRAIQLLSLGLRLAGGPIRVSLKDLSILYEYWCYISVLKIISSLFQKDIAATALIRPEQSGLKVMLQRGHQTVVSFDLSNSRRIRVTYNPQFRGEQSFLVPQQPDILLTIEDASWPAVHIVLDAKYRIDSSPETVSRYKSPGPPQDALNVLHRYRDAIVDTEKPSDKPKRTIIEAAALFPYRELQPGAFRASRLWGSLERIGVGAIPMLPNGTSYFSEYLERILLKSGWSLAELATRHRSLDCAADWREAASKPVLVGVLRPDYEAQHLAWIEKERMYYMPMLRRQRRQYQVSSLLIFSPAALRSPGAITHVADVETIEVLSRSEITTPWHSRREVDRPQVVYRLRDVRKLEKPIPIKAGGSLGLRRPRWTSELGARRAATINELILETEPEWRLHENLQLSGIDYEVTAGAPDLEDPEDPQGRAWFKTGSCSIQYRGAAGFLIRRIGLPDRYLPSGEAVIAFLSRIWPESETTTESS